jgi:hypothetical protein
MFVDVTAIRVALRNQRTPESHRGEYEKGAGHDHTQSDRACRLGARGRRPQPGVGAGEPREHRLSHQGQRLGNGHPQRFDGSYTGDATQVSTCIGKSTVHLDGIGAFTGPDTFVGSGPITLTAANGDELTGTHTLTATGFTPGTAHTTTVVATITGGTGQFAEASGTVTSTAQVTSSSFDGVTLVSTVEYTATGQLSF